MVESKHVTHGNSVRISGKTYTAEFKSKSEILNFLVVDCKAYLPNHKQATNFYLRSLVAGEKKGNLTSCLLPISSSERVLRPCTTQCPNTTHWVCTIFLKSWDGGLKCSSDYLFRKSWPCLKPDSPSSFYYHLSITKNYAWVNSGHGLRILQATQCTIN